MAGQGGECVCNEKAKSGDGNNSVSAEIVC